MTRANGALVVFVVALAASAATLASSAPDGLERVAEDLGFAERADTVIRAPLPDYGSESARPGLAGALAGVGGAALVGGLAYAIGRWSARRA